MTGWIGAFLLAFVALAALLWAGRVPRATWELVAAAVLCGIAGYAWQGSPGLAGAPRTAADQSAPFDESLAEQRRALGERFGKAGQWLVLSDGLGRQGKTQEAANVLVAAVRQDPKDPNLWLGLGNALVAHAGGVISPSAEFAFHRAMAIDATAPAAPYFYGLALAQSGQLDNARKIWAPLAMRLPEGSKLRTELEQNLQMIDSRLGGS
ncbi:MAG: cytochrome C biosynthesis protein [Sphingobium sp.]|uniref:tetratricopeptide repeat protein n=1 Tax=Sphingobium sp. TaxID=1912891 RepID=UPI00299FFC3C|nr:tetratricopeptide repeat protein [Sphingobium sp.]MDX3908808.1 cytochrome C biosynthesis protein [Sphingobium sp.]